MSATRYFNEATLPISVARVSVYVHTPGTLEQITRCHMHSFTSEFNFVDTFIEYSHWISMHSALVKLTSELPPKFQEELINDYYS